MKPTTTDTALATARHHLTWHDDWIFVDADKTYVGNELETITMKFKHDTDNITATFTFNQRVG